MTAPTTPACACGHSKADHEVLAPQCAARACTCLRYRPHHVTVSPPAKLADQVQPVAAPDVAPGIDALLDRGRASELKPINKLTERIAALVDDLRERLAAEDAADSLKAEIAKLEARLADRKGKLRDVGRGHKPASKPAATREPGVHACPDCTDTFATPQGVGAHRSRKHGYRRPAA